MVYEGEIMKYLLMIILLFVGCTREIITTSFDTTELITQEMLDKANYCNNCHTNIWLDWLERKTAIIFDDDRNWKDNH